MQREALGYKVQWRALKLINWWEISPNVVISIPPPIFCIYRRITSLI
jgi:hypothetical protein